jgi:hypothetical protein
MDRQRAIVAGVAAAVVFLVVLAIGFVVGRASVDDRPSAATDPGTSSDSDGLPAGPARLEDGVPVGFAHSEDGALSAALSWVPWLISSPASERPDGIDGVLATGVEPPVPEGISQRLQYVPWAAGIEMASSNEATVSLWGTPLRGEPGQDLDGGVWPLTATLVWDDDVGDWRVTAAEVGPEPVDFPISASDVAGLRVVRFTGGLLAGPVLEEVPGD